MIAVLYVSTLFLNVHFRGDFGIVTERVLDAQNTSRMRCLQCLNGNTFVPRRAGESSFLENLKEYVLMVMLSTVNCVLDVASVPRGDLQFLISPGAAVATHGGLINNNPSGFFSGRNYKNG